VASSPLTELRELKPRSSGEIGFKPVLNNPAGLVEERVNLPPRPMFGVMVGRDRQVQLWTKPSLKTEVLEGAIASEHHMSIK
jgi:hypothetical protein